MNTLQKTELILGQTKNYKIGICCFFAKHTAFRWKSEDWLARMVCPSVSADYCLIPTKRGGLYKVDLIIISLKNISYCNAERCKCPLNEQYKY
jgi:hypothetical protein